MSYQDLPMKERLAEARAVLRNPTPFAAWLAGVEDDRGFNPYSGGECPLHDYLESPGFEGVGVSLSCVFDFTWEAPDALLSGWPTSFQDELCKEATRRAREADPDHNIYAETELSAVVARDVLARVLAEVA